MTENRIREKVEQLLRKMSGAIQAFKMYGDSHDITRNSARELYGLFDEILTEKGVLTVGIIGDEIAFEKEPFYEASRQMHGFIEQLKKIETSKVSFKKGVSEDELLDFIGVLCMSAEKIEKEGGLEGIFLNKGIMNIMLGELGKEKKEEDQINQDSLGSANKTFTEGEEVLKDVSDNVLSGQDIDIKRVRFFVNSMINNLLVNKSAFLILTAVKSHDEYSFIHNINVAVFSLLQAEGLDLEKGYTNEIGVAALLHDVGKLAIPSEVLNKKEKLDLEEFEVVKAHPIYGAKILLESPEVPATAAKVAFEHHVRWDRSGYPTRRYGKRPGLATMIVTIADVYDALRSKRSYREEMAPEKTHEEMMKESGTFFNPDLLEYFFKIIGIYPPGTLVELDSGEIALVIKESALDINRPQVEIIYDKKGKLIDPAVQARLVSKDAKTGKYKRSVKKSIVATKKIKVPEKYLF